MATILWDDVSFAAVEAALTPKQLKVVNFVVGQVMRRGENARRSDPKLLRRLVIQRLSEAAHEPEADGVPA